MKENKRAMFPVITVQLEGIQLAMQQAFSQELLRLDEMFQAAIKDACSEEKIQALLNASAEKHLKEAVDYAVRDYFVNGRAREMIVEKVRECLDARRAESEATNGQ